MQEGQSIPPSEHSDFVLALAKDGAAIARELTPSEAHQLHMAMGISSEAGELLEAVKKAAIYNKPIDRENVVEELGDLEFYMEVLRQALLITREETIEYNMAKLTKRYGAQERADKV